MGVIIPIERIREKKEGKKTAEYIEHEKAQKIICGWCGICENPTLNDLMHCDDICPQFAQIAQIPAADVRPVVLCRDCKYFCKDADGYEMCDNSEGYDHVTEDGFCAWAVKREES